jgi:hypothetical protein
VLSAIYCKHHAPVDSVTTLDELYCHELLRLCVAGQLHKAKAAMAEVCYLDITCGLPERIRVAGLHASCAHGAVYTEDMAEGCRQS